MVTVKWHEQGVGWTYFGSVRGEEIVNASTGIYSDPRFDDLRYKLCDFLNVDDINVTVSEIDKIVCQHAAAAHTNTDIKIAVVGKKSDFDKLLLLIERFRNYESRGSWPIELFEDMPSVWAWLNAE